MKKFFRLGKRMMALFIVVLLNINSYAAVSANDGSAFVTKAEFDALVNTFNEQMDAYQSGLNAKIDGAIANYLAGLSSVQITNRAIVYPDSNEYGVLSISEKSPLNYSYGVPICKGWTARVDFRTNANPNYTSSAKANYNGGAGSKAQKTLITNLWDNQSNPSTSTAAWYGYYGCIDTVALAGIDFNNTYDGINSLVASQFSPYAMYAHEDKELFASADPLGYVTSMSNSTTRANNGLTFGLQIQAITHVYDTKPTYKYVSVLTPYNYDMFSNYDRDKNWGYKGINKDKFKDFGGPEWNAKNSTGDYTSDIPKQMLGSMDITLRYRGSSGGAAQEISQNNQNIANWIWRGNSGSVLYAPCVGFETKYLTNWKQIYDGNSSSIGKFEKDKHSSETGYANRAIIHDNVQDQYCIGLSGGFPLIEMKRGEKLSYDIEFKDKSKNYVLWVSKRPFDLTGHPDDDENCLELTGVNKASGCNRGYSIIEGKATITTPEMTDDCYLYLKWGINAATKADIGGGILIPAKTGQVTSE